jgi:hypothetical protein
VSIRTDARSEILEVDERDLENTANSFCGGCADSIDHGHASFRPSAYRIREGYVKTNLDDRFPAAVDIQADELASPADSGGPPAAGLQTARANSL